MPRRTLLKWFAICGILLAVLQAGAMALFDQYPYESLFTPSHFVGGLVVAFFALYLASGFGIRATGVRILFVILVVGIAWELLEVIAGMNTYFWEAMSDLVADVAGAFTAYWISRKTL